MSLALMSAGLALLARWRARRIVSSNRQLVQARKFDSLTHARQ
ncbi:MAG: hypothetical protein KDH88_09275 [Chromatiales bacterium]|nr:hypothetical protein [Chromatiales bacterium]